VLRLVRDVNDPMTIETAQAARDARLASSVIAVLQARMTTATARPVPRTGRWQ
jgi:hypothetical protein